MYFSSYNCDGSIRYPSTNPLGKSLGYQFALFRANPSEEENRDIQINLPFSFLARIESRRGDKPESGIFDVKDAPRTGRPIVNKITEQIEVDRHVSNCSITQELKIDQKTVLNHLRKVGFKKKLHVWVLYQLMVIGDEKLATNDNIV
ncbi:histone-lysine N-methyltransferase SETMAR [Trichonephila clavipes]|nr:histone-lysine N-methyltransferase SETMAR [Trichonephila clavipes]